MVISIRFFFAIGLTLLFPLSITMSATLRVTNNHDSGDGSLRHAVINASAGDTIIIEEGIGSIVLSSGQITIEKSLIIRGGIIEKSIIDGNAQSRVFSSPISNSIVALENLNIRNGKTTLHSDDSYPCFPQDGNGAGICSTGVLHLKNVTMEKNRAEYADGGAIYLSNNSESSQIENSLFNENFSGRNGGALVVSKTTNISSTIITDNMAGQNGGGVVGGNRITNSLITNNQAGSVPYGSGTGGGVSRTKTIEYSTIRNNRANSDGGGASNIESLRNSVIEGNYTDSDYASGGGLNYITTISNSLILGNYTLGESSLGGGVNTVTHLKNSVISDNYTKGASSSGGGIHNAYQVVNCTIHNNHTYGSNSYGGGVSNAYNLISGSTIVGNSTKYVSGGGVSIRNNGLNMISSIIAKNTQNGVPNDYFVSEIYTLKHSLIETTNPNDNFNQNNITDNLFGLAPKLETLKDNGCAIKAGYERDRRCVMTMALLPDSPAINAGAHNGAYSDQRGGGYKRISDGQADIGAFELQSASNNLNIIFSNGFEILFPLPTK